MACKIQTSSLVAVAPAGQALIVGSPVTYNYVRVHTGKSIGYNSGDSTVYLKNEGLYLVAFDGDFTITTTGAVTFQLFNNGEAVYGAENTIQATAAVPQGVHFATLIEVKPSCPAIDNTASLQVQTNAIGTLVTGDITVLKVG